VRYCAARETAVCVPGTLDHFLLERYLFFTEIGGRTWSGRVQHAPYPVSAVPQVEVEESLFEAAGLPAAASLSADGRPVSARYSPGVEVEVFALEREE
jgi:hypothetical protein